MIDNEILKQSIKLSQMIAKTEEYLNLKRAHESIRANSEAYQVMVNYQKLGMEANKKMMQGIALSKSEINTLSEHDLKIKNNEMLQHWAQCQEIFNKMMESILLAIQQELNNEAAYNSLQTAEKPKRLNLYPQ